MRRPPQRQQHAPGPGPGPEPEPELGPVGLGLEHAVRGSDPAGAVHEPGVAAGSEKTVKRVVAGREEPMNLHHENTGCDIRGGLVSATYSKAARKKMRGKLEICAPRCLSGRRRTDERKKKKAKLDPVRVNRVVRGGCMSKVAGFKK